MPLLARKKPPLDILSREIPRNPAYSTVVSSIDAGDNVNRRLRKLEEFKADYHIGRDEVFRRLKPTTFVQLILQVAQENNKHYLSSPDSSRDSNNNEDDNINQKNVKTNGKPIDSPYLLLDVRLKDSFDECHIITAKSYPIAMLNRSMNYESPPMLRFKNKPGHIIIVYDNDESLSSKAASVLVERGYSNVLLLSGGLKVCWKFFPRGLIAGKMPAEIQRVFLGPDLRKRRSFKGKHCASGDDTASLSSTWTGATTRSSRGSSMSNSSTRFEKRWLPSDFEPYCEVTSRKRLTLGPDEELFTIEDLAQLSILVDQLISKGLHQHQQQNHQQHHRRVMSTNRVTNSTSRLSQCSSRTLVPFK